jgi:prevent-host-death family protein
LYFNRLHLKKNYNEFDLWGMAMVSNSVGIREAKIDLSKILKKVRNGREVVITDRGHPIAKIVPLVSENLPLEERVRRLEGEGVLRPLSKKSRSPLPPPLPAPEGAAQGFLQEDRNR